MAAPSVAEAFKSFVASEELGPIVDSFATLVEIAHPSLFTLPPWERYSALRGGVLPHVPFIAQRLFQQLDARWALSATQRKRVADAGVHTVVVSGSGPCGLRASVELCLLGFRVHLVEKRREFSRHNILKTWSGTVDDLVALGFKNYYPTFKTHGRHSIGTREIQTCLLKTALLLGVEFVVGEAVSGILAPDAEWNGSPAGSSWRVFTESSQHGSFLRSFTSPEPSSTSSPALEPEELALHVGEQDVGRLAKTSKVDFFEAASSTDGAIVRAACMAECIDRLPPADRCGRIIDFNSLVIAEGESSQLVRHLGFDRLVTRYNQAIGIIVNLKFDPNNAAEKKLPEFVYARSMADWQQTPVGVLSRDHGILVENIEYLRFSTHFVVVTALRDNLVKCGVLRENRSTVKASLAADNVDLDRLMEYARTLGTVAGVPASVEFADKHACNIFDFSCKGKLAKIHRILGEDSGALVAPIGDTLQNPFWPQGLGVNRGFQSSLDAVWAIYLKHAGDGGWQQAQEEHLSAWKLLTWFPFRMELLLPGGSWSADPLSRYSPTIAKSIYNESLASKRDVELSERILASINVRRT